MDTPQRHTPWIHRKDTPQAHIKIQILSDLPLCPSASNHGLQHSGLFHAHSQPQHVTIHM